MKSLNVFFMPLSIILIMVMMMDNLVIGVHGYNCSQFSMKDDEGYWDAVKKCPACSNSDGDVH